MLMRSQGRAAWRRFNAALAEGRIPHREVLDGALVIFGGALLLTPGFITDILGIILLLPPTRALVRGLVARRLLPRIVISRFGAPGAAARPPAAARPGGRRGGPAPAADVEGTATEVDPPPAAVNVSPADDAPRPRGGDGFSDAVTVSFGDARADLYGVARLGLADNGASGLAILFRGGEPVAVRAEGGVEAGDADGVGRASRPPGSTPRSSSRCAPGGCTSPPTTRASTSTCAPSARSRSSIPTAPSRRPAAWRATSSRAA